LIAVLAVLSITGCNRKASDQIGAAVKGSDISVETKQGEVMLLGAVKNLVQIDKVLQIANAVTGVRSVNNNMVMKQ